MSEFYKITKAQADLIGRFNYDEFSGFDPFVGEQKDGSYLIEKKMYDLLKETIKFQSVDFAKLTKITDIQLDPKDTEIKPR